MCVAGDRLSPKAQDDLRLRIFDDLARLTELHGGFLPRASLLHFRLAGHELPLVDRSRGIRNPSVFDATLSILTSKTGPYGDSLSDQGILSYDYARGGAGRGDNKKLRVAYETATPIIMFQKIPFQAPLRYVYVPYIGAFVVGEHVDEKQFDIAVDTDAARNYQGYDKESDQSIAERSYIERLIRQRVHQPIFRARVVHAYAERCAICRLRHPELLDAAHIIPDAQGGAPVTTNGLSLCKIHHAAYDADLIGIDADAQVHVREDLLGENDGPMAFKKCRAGTSRFLVGRLTGRAATPSPRDSASSRTCRRTSGGSGKKRGLHRSGHAARQ